MKLLHTVTLNLLCFASTEALNKALKSGKIKKISARVTPRTLLKCNTNRLTKALQVGRGSFH